MVDKYKVEFESNLSNMPLPYWKRKNTLWFNKKLDDEFSMLIAEKCFYERKGVYYGQLMADHEEELDRVCSEWYKWNTKETIWVFIISFAIGLTLLILFFDFIVGIILGAVCFVCLIGSVLAKG